MPPRKKPKSAPPASLADRIGALPDHMLHHLLSFLPVQAAVRTCVLARRWRHLWRSTTGLRIVPLHHNYAPAQDFRKFLYHLLILRERTDLETVEIRIDKFVKEDQPYGNLWIRYAVMCQVRVLTLHVFHPYLRLDDLPIVSRHLRTLDLRSVALQQAVLDFDNCPALEDLKMCLCEINAGRISSRSLKHLIITDCRCDLDYRIRVSAPDLLSLKLAGFEGKTPFLENMPLLETAHVDLGKECGDLCLNFLESMPLLETAHVDLLEECEDLCLNYDSGALCGANINACENCVPTNDDIWVILGGVSDAKHLKLISEPGLFIFTRDLRHCPTFSKLKTLLLNEYWCQPPDYAPLACILKNSPVLEKLTLQLFFREPEDEMELKGTYSPMEGPSPISEHLKIVEVKCNVVDKKVLKVMKFLSALHIRFSFE